MVVPIAVRGRRKRAWARCSWSPRPSARSAPSSSRGDRQWLTRLVDRLVNGLFRMVTGAIADYRRRDRVLAAQAATILPPSWLPGWDLPSSATRCCFGRSSPISPSRSPRRARPLWEIGSSHVSGAAEHAIQDIASLSGIITVTLQIAYLPTLYSAFNRRGETRSPC